MQYFTAVDAVTDEMRITCQNVIETGHNEIDNNDLQFFFVRFHKYFSILSSYVTALCCCDHIKLFYCVFSPLTLTFDPFDM